MAHGLVITKDEGLVDWEWDGDSRSEHNIKKIDGKHVISRKEDGKVLGKYDTREEAEERFWKRVEKDHAWTLLRSPVTIEEGIAVADIRDLIENNAELEVFCSKVFPFYEVTDIPDYVRIFRRGNISQGELTFSLMYEERPVYEDPLAYPLPFASVPGVIIDNVTKVYDYIGNVVFEGEYDLSLLDVLVALFGTAQEPVFLSKDGLTTESGETVEPFKVLLAPVTVADGMTVGEVFDFVAKDEDLQIFIAMYSWCRSITEFHEEAKKPNPEPDEEDNHLFHALLDRSIDVHLADRYYDKTHLEEGIDFHALGKCSGSTLEHYQKYSKEPPPETETYSLSGSHASVYAKLPLKVDEMVEVWQRPTFSRKGKIKTEQKLLAKVRCSMTLLEVLDGIYWDISFYGGPAKRDNFMKDLCGRMEDVKSGKAETIPLEDFLKELDEEEGEEEN